MFGNFIVFEGMDGTGKSTQVKLLHEHCCDVNLKTILTYEPTRGNIGQSIRSHLLDRTLSFIDDGELSNTNKFIAHLVAADRHQHLYSVGGVLDHLKSGVNVICDRYVLSSYIYNAKSVEELEFVKRLNSEFPQPDLVIHLQGSPELSRRRLVGKKTDIYEQDEYLSAAYQREAKIMNEYSGLKLVVDASLSEHIIHSTIVESVNELLNL